MSAAGGPVFTVDGLVLDRGSALTGFRVTRERGWYAGPPVRATVTDRQGAHGGVDGPSWRGPRTVTLGGTGRWASHEDAMTAVRSLTALDLSPGLLAVTDALGTLTARVRLASEPYVQWVSDDTVSWDVGLTAPDHRKYGPPVVFSAALPTDQAGGLDAGSGLSTNASGVLDAGDPPSLGAVRVRNPGTAPSDPVIRLVAGSGGLAGPVEVLEWSTGRRLTYAGSLAAGQFVTLDAAAKSVLLDGYANRRELLTRAQWWQVPAGGDVAVSWSHNAEPSPGTQMEITVAPAYL